MRPFLFTTENIASFIGELNLKGKKIAGISASADFIINAFMQGAESFDPVDIVETACFTGEVKLAALREFNYYEFLNFFDPDSPQFLSYGQYERLKPNISKHAKHFYDQLITPDENLIPENMFLYDRNKDIKKINPYLQSPENYEKAQINIKEKQITFHTLDIRKFLDESKGKDYDHIYLSNVIAYLLSKDNKVEIIPTIQRANNALVPWGEASTYTHVEKTFNPEDIQNLEDIYTTYVNMHGIRMTARVISGEDPLYLLQVYTKTPDR